MMSNFVDRNNIPGGGRIIVKEENARNAETGETEPNRHGYSQSNHYEPGVGKNLVFDISNCGRALKTTMLAVETTTNLVPSQRQKRGRALEAISIPLQTRPAWLPEGWWIDYRVRSSGATAGLMDKYYVEPKNGFRFRSKKEVDYFLETGSKRGRKPTSDADANSFGSSWGCRKRKAASDADANSFGSSGDSRQKKLVSEIQSSDVMNFNFNSVVDNARQVLADPSRDQWMPLPLFRNKALPESSRQDWNAGFHFCCCPGWCLDCVKERHSGLMF